MEAKRSLFGSLLRTLVRKSVVQYGWLPDPPDVRDEQHTIFDSPIADAATGDCDNRDYFLGVSAQLSFPSCTANAGVDALEAAWVRKLTQAGIPLDKAKQQVPELSRMYAWYWGRSFMEPSAAEDATSGCFNRLIMEVFARFGTPPETLWPYDNTLLPPHNKPRSVVRPSIAAQRSALRYRTSRFYSIPCSNKYNLVTGIDKALNAGHAVVWGTAVGASIIDYEGGVAEVPTKIEGYHAMVLVGKAKGNYVCRNSWGAGYGDGGYCLVSPAYVTWNKSSSFWVLSLE